MPHNSHDSESRAALIITSILLALFVVTVNIDWPIIQPLVTHSSVIHILVEITVIAIAVMTFSIVWGIRAEKPCASLVLLASVFLCVGILDLAHLLSYKDMPEFITPGSREKSIYFWQAAILFGSLALLAIAIRPVRKHYPKFSFATVLPVCLIITFLFIWFYFAVLAKKDNFYLIGNHLTDTKLFIEYLLIFMNFAAAAIFLKRMFEPRFFNSSALFAASFTLGLGEYYYTIYSSTTDFYNLLGHIYKIIGFAFLYWAVFAETLSNPYKQLRESRQQLQATMQAMPDLVFEIDSNYQFIGNYSAYTEGLYVPEHAFLGKTVQEVFPADVADICIKSLDEARNNGISRGNVICLPIDNQNRWFEMSVSTKPMPDDQDAHYVVISREITARLENEKALHILSHAFSQSPMAFFITDVNHVIELCNQAYAKLCNAKISDIIGKRPFDIPGSFQCQEVLDDILQNLERGRPWQGELSHKTASNDEIILRVMIFPVRNSLGEVSNFITHMQNITDKKHAEARIRQLSQFDLLTNLPNVSLLQEQFEFLQARKEQVAVFWVDVDNFKDVNDSFGHHVGDDLLRIIARRLNKHTDKDCMVSRLSGDDFLVVMSINSQAEAATEADKIANLFSVPINMAGQEIFVTLSIGVAIYPDDGDDFDALLQNAESAKYRAKNLGRNNICYFKQEMQTNARRFLAISNSLKQAHIRNELRMVYHPQFKLADHSLVGAEALVRWSSPLWGDVEPEEFIRIAESSGSIIAISDWILENTIRQISIWCNQGLKDFTIAINLSPIQFNSPELANTISGLINKYKLNPACMALEITEAMTMVDPEDTVKKIRQLQELNIKFAIDDFGTGYSSLSYLKQFKIQKIKIDQSFINDLVSDEDEQAIVNAIVQMARQLGIVTTAEGVETAEQMAILKDLGCDEVQGFYLSKPLEVDQFSELAKKYI